MYRNEKNNYHCLDCETTTDNLSRRGKEIKIIPILPQGKIQGIFELNKKIGRSLEKIFKKIFRDDSFVFGCAKALTLAAVLSTCMVSESRAVTCEWEGTKLTVTGIGGEEFTGCPDNSDHKSATEVTFKEGITSIGDGAFSNATSLQSVDMPNVTTIGDGAFGGASSLTSVDIPMLEKIGDIAFYTTGITYINIPSDVEYCFNYPDFMGGYTCTGEYVSDSCSLFGYSPLCPDAYTDSGNCTISNGKLVCGSCNGYTKSGTGCVTDCGEGYTANAENQCIKNPEETPEIGEQSGNHVPTAESCYANGQVFYKEQCWDEFPFSKKKWTPAEAAQWLNEDDNTVTITFKK